MHVAHTDNRFLSLPRIPSRFLSLALILLDSLPLYFSLLPFLFLSVSVSVSFYVSLSHTHIHTITLALSRAHSLFLSLALSLSLAFSLTERESVARAATN